METFGGKLTLHPVLVMVQLLVDGVDNVTSPSEDNTMKAEVAVHDEFLPYLTLSVTGRKKLRSPKDKLVNAALFEQDIYPRMHNKLFNMLNNYKDEVAKVRTDSGKQELVFMQQED